MKKNIKSLILLISLLLIILSISSVSADPIDIDDYEMNYGDVIMNINDYEMDYGGIITLNANGGPVPNANVNPHLQDVFIGDTFYLNLSFTNVGNETGFGPGAQLIVPYGINITSASYIGLNVYLTKVGTFTAANNYTVYDPMVKSNVTLDSSYENYTLYTVKYPLGSFTAGSPQASIGLTGILDKDVPLGEYLDITAVPWFIYGKDDAPGDEDIDPPIKGNENIAYINPIIIKVHKESTLNEDETATGKNYPFEYVVYVELAPGISLDNITIEDIIPENLKYLGNLTITNPAGMTFTATEPSPDNTGGNLLITLDSSITGAPTGYDLILRYWVYAPEYYMVNGINTTLIIGHDGRVSIANNTVIVKGTVNRTINGTEILINVSGNDTEVVRLLPLAVQKHTSPGQGQTIVPGEKIIYTINYQVSDYFALDDFMLYDTLGNQKIEGEGQSLDYSSLVTFTYKNLSFTFNLTDTRFCLIEKKNNLTYITFNGTAMLNHLGINNLTGGLWDNLTMGNPSSNNGAARGYLQFTTIVNKKFRSDDAGVEYSLRNYVVGNATNLNGNNVVADGSSTVLHFPRLVLDKEIYAINGNTSLDSEIHVSPGDNITYKLHIEVPAGTTDFVNLTDYLPANLFKNYDLTGKLNTTTGQIPTAGNWAYLDNGRLYDSNGNVIIPDVSIFGENIVWFFNDTLEDVSTKTMRTLTILFTVTVSDYKMENGLLLSNRAVLSWSYTVNTTLESQTIALLVLNQPDLTINKSANQTSGIENNTKVQYSINVTNKGDAPAFNINITDDFFNKYSNYGNITDMYIEYSNGTRHTLTTTEIDALFNSTEGLNIAVLNENDYFTIFYTVTFNANPDPMESIKNTARITQFLPRNDSPTNFVTNPEEYKDSVTITAEGINFTKVFWKNNITGGNNLTIGEIGVFNLTFDLPELYVTNLTLTDKLPAGLRYINYTLVSGDGTNLQFTTYGQNIIFTFVGEFAPTNKNFTILLYFEVLNNGDNSLAGLITKVNEAKLTWVNPDGISLTRNAPVTIVQPVISVSKEFENDVMFSYENNTITITVKNNGASTAYNVTVTDDISNFINDYFNITGFSAVGNSSFTYNNNIITVSYGDMAPGDSYTIKIFFESLDLLIGLSYDNTAYATYSSLPLNSSNPNIRTYNSSGPATLSTEGGNITKIIAASIYHGAGEATIGDVLTYNITAQLPGGHYQNIIIEDLLPEGLEYINHTISYGGTATYSDSFVNDNGKLTLTLNGLTNVTSKVFTINIVVNVRISDNPTNTKGTLKTNVVNMTWDNSTSVFNANATVKLVEPKLEVTKIANVTDVNIGDVVKYNVTITNIGDATAYNINITDILPEGLVYNGNIVLNPTNGWTLSYNPLTKMITVFGYSLNASSSFSFTFDVIIENKTVILGTNITNVANVIYSSSNSTEGRTYNLEGNSTVYVLASDLVVTIENITEIIAGTNITYLINITNNGPDTASDVNLTAYISELLGDVYYELNGVWYSGSDILSLSLGDMAPGQTILIKVNGTLNSNATGSLTNNVGVSTPTDETNYTNNNASITNNISTLVDLAITKDVSNSSSKYLDLINYTITIVNNGPSDATGVSVYDLLPNGLVYINHTSGLVYDPVTGLWNVGTLASGESLTLVLTVLVNATGNLTNAVNVSGNDKDSNITNNNDSIILNIPPAYDVQVLLNVSNNDPNYLDDVVYTITVKNNGPDNVTGVNVSDILNGLKYLNSSATKGLFDSDSGVWEIGNLTVGEEVVLTLTFKVNHTGIVNTTVDVTANEVEFNLLNNNATSLLNVSLASLLTVNKTVDSEIVVIGSTITYTIIVENKGPDNATGVYVLENLPEGLKFVSALADKGTYDGATGKWTIGLLNVGETATLYLTVLVTKVGNIVNNVSVFSDNYNYGNVSNITASANITVVSLPADPLGNDKPAQGAIALKETGNPIGILLLALIALFIVPLRRKL